MSQSPASLGRVPEGVRPLRAIAFVLLTLAWQSVLLLVADFVLSGFDVRDWSAAFAGAALISVLNVVAWPLLIRVLQRFNFVPFLVLTLVLNGASVLITQLVLPGIWVDGVFSAALVLVLLAMGTSLIALPFTYHAADYFTLRAIRAATTRSARLPPTHEPGVLFLQIDGLSEPVLRAALEAGHMPTLRAWLERGSHRLVGWEADLPCQTSASQAGILFGSNNDIPAFRWLEKPSGRVFVSNHPRDARDIEARFDASRGLLVNGGVARGNIFSGGATDVMLTFSTALDPAKRQSAGFAAYFSSPLNLWRTLMLVGWEVCLELAAQVQVRVAHTEPRGNRGFPYPIVRALTTTFLRDLVVYTLIGDILRGVPAVYADFVGYDEVAHHSGILAPDALATLRRIDGQIGRLARATTSAPRPYHFVLLSDHGQTQGATFKQRYGLTLGEVVNTLTAGTDHVRAEEEDEGDTWGHLNTF